MSILARKKRHKLDTTKVIPKRRKNIRSVAFWQLHFTYIGDATLARRRSIVQRKSRGCSHVTSLIFRNRPSPNGQNPSSMPGLHWEAPMDDGACRWFALLCICKKEAGKTGRLVVSD